MRSGLAGLLLIISLPLSACGGSSEETTTSEESVAALDTATATSDLSVELTRLVDDLGSVERVSRAKDLERELADIRETADELAADVGSGPGSASLASALRASSDSAQELEETAAALAAAIEERTRERDPSEQASAELARASRDVKRLTIRVSTAGADLRRALRSLEQALGELAADPSLDTESQERVAAVEQQLARLARDAERATDALQGKLKAEAELLVERSEELTPEPPDVVLDCVSTVETASDVSVRNMSCEEADTLILQAIPSLAPSFTVGEFSCTILGDYGGSEGLILGASDVRCASGDRAFRFGFAD